MTDRPFDGLAWLPGGILLGVSGDQVGVYSIGDAAKSGKGTAHVPFQPLGQYPGKKLAIYGGSGDVAYIVVSDEKGSEVVLLVRKKTSWGVDSLLSTIRTPT
jgi:hypothetical protein